jgi:hypothetical protein
MTPPDHRALALADGAKPTGPLEQGLVDLLAGKDAPPAVVYAREIYEDPYKSEVMESFLLASATPQLVFDTLRIPVDVTVAYSHLFFDRAAFRDELDVEQYAHNYPVDTAEKKYGKDLKEAALVLGAEYLAYRFNRNERDLDLAGALKSMISQSFQLTRAAKLNPLDSNATREARQWVATATKALEAYVRVAPATTNTDDEWKIALANIERATNEAKSSILKEEIVH